MFREELVSGNASLSSYFSDDERNPTSFFARRDYPSLFQTRAWQDSWWEVWGDQKSFQLLPDESGWSSNFYLDHQRIRSFVIITSLQLKGSNYRTITTPRAEYLDVLPRGGLEHEYRAFLSELLNQPWDELVIRDLLKDSACYQALQSWASRNNLLVRQLHSDRAYAIDCSTGSFDSYSNQLGKNTRLKLVNRRSRLQRKGHLVELVDAFPNRIDHFFEKLQKFHMARWGDCFGKKSLEFQRLFLDRIVQEGGQPELSMLLIDGECLSVLYNIHWQGRIYNLQSGFEANFDSQVSLGTLHFGYSIEAAFANPEVRVFDFLAGTGKNADYKKKLATMSTELVSLMFVRTPKVKWLYKTRDKWSTP